MYLDWYGTLYRRFWQFRGGQFTRQIFQQTREMSQRETISVEALRDFQLARMRTLLIHAYQQVPFHRERMEAAGFNPFEMSAVETEGFCDKCGKHGLGFSFKTVDSRGDYMGKSGAYWCPKCGEGMDPEAYEDFVQSELITPEM